MSKWKIYTWKCFQGALAVRWSLRRRGVEVETECFFCKQGDESVIYLFRDCVTIRRVWFIIFGFKEEGNILIDFKE